METLYKIIRKDNNEILSKGLTKFMVDYLLIEKKWPKDKISIIEEK